VKKEKGTLQTTPLADLMSRAVDQVNELEIFPHSRPRLKRFRDNMAQNALINVLSGGPFDSATRLQCGRQEKESVARILELKAAAANKF